jgi:hypothetical protein
MDPRDKVTLSVRGDSGRPRWSTASTIRTSTTPSVKIARLLEVNLVPRTREQLEQALAETEERLDSIDPAALASPDSDVEDLRAIGDAMHAVAQSDLQLAERVAEARAKGRTWTQIAAVLGVSKQAARERFGEPAHR